MATHRVTARRGALVRASGVALIAVGVLAAGTAYADAGSGPDVLNNVTNVIDGVTGGSAAKATSDTSGRAAATITGRNDLRSDDNAGAGGGNQAGVTGQAPVSVDCNGVTLLGAALSTCPEAAGDDTAGTGYGYGAGDTGGYGYGGGPGGGYGSPSPTPTPTVKATTGKKPHVLAETGTDAVPLGLAGGALLVAGAGLVLVSRRPARRRGAHCA